MNKPTIIEIAIPQNGFYIICDNSGQVDGAGDVNGPWLEGKVSISERTPAQVEDYNLDMALMKIKKSPGHWCVIAGRRRWCPG
jgi:hypothetical protein